MYLMPTDFTVKIFEFLWQITYTITKKWGTWSVYEHNMKPSHWLVINGATM